MKKSALIIFCLFFLTSISFAQEFQKIPYGNLTLVMEPSISADVALHLLYLVDTSSANEVYIYHLPKDATNYVFEAGELWSGHKYQIYAVAVNSLNMFSDLSNSLYFEVEKNVIPAEKKPVIKDKPLSPELSK